MRYTNLLRLWFSASQSKTAKSLNTWSHWLGFYFCVLSLFVSVSWQVWAHSGLEWAVAWCSCLNSGSRSSVRTWLWRTLGCVCLACSWTLMRALLKTPSTHLLVLQPSRSASRSSKYSASMTRTGLTSAEFLNEKMTPDNFGTDIGLPNVAIQLHNQSWFQQLLHLQDCLIKRCSCGSVVKHCISSAKGWIKGFG